MGLRNALCQNLSETGINHRITSQKGASSAVCHTLNAEADKTGKNGILAPYFSGGLLLLGPIMRVPARVIICGPILLR